ncbi:putative signal peptide protein [Puccinia sorghi]|uniref:Putative signal peptide protein n=1 Tax=Puccinia sorghi TaxID=27349 RepID=A0A0L6UTA2_9BASI|nr:putative signal peptide protein [Puccinia sorghi]
MDKRGIVNFFFFLIFVEAFGSFSATTLVKQDGIGKPTPNFDVSYVLGVDSVSEAEMLCLKGPILFLVLPAFHTHFKKAQRTFAYARRRKKAFSGIDTPFHGFQILLKPLTGAWTTIHTPFCVTLVFCTLHQIDMSREYKLSLASQHKVDNYIIDSEGKNAWIFWCCLLGGCFEKKKDLIELKYQIQRLPKTRVVSKPRQKKKWEPKPSPLAKQNLAMCQDLRPVPADQATMGTNPSRNGTENNYGFRHLNQRFCLPSKPSASPPLLPVVETQTSTHLYLKQQKQKQKWFCQLATIQRQAVIVDWPFIHFIIARNNYLNKIIRNIGMSKSNHITQELHSKRITTCFYACQIDPWKQKKFPRRLNKNNTKPLHPHGAIKPLFSLRVQNTYIQSNAIRKELH